ncbi:MAG: hypothetical protein Q7S70_00125, partial [bacterium]|nr:hypothetical protein [bacterium]
MKKISLVLVFTALLIPFFVFAEGTQECVKIRRDIKFEGSNCNKAPAATPPNDVCPKGDVVGASGGTCDILTTGSMPTVSGANTLKGGSAVGAWVTEKWGAVALINIINTIVDWIFAFLVIFAVFYVIMGAYNILTSAGSPQKVTSGRNFILYAVIGLLVAFIARAIPSLVKS